MKTTKRVTTIEDLPPEMISELFEYLGLKDLIICSLVNKLWHSIYSNFKVHSVVAIENFKVHNLVAIEDDLFRWHGSNQLIQETERCSRAMFRHLAEKPLLSNLKHLAVHASSYSETKFDLNELNRFQQLFHLEIKIDDLNQRNVHLNLPCLKVLALSDYNNRCALSIDCPQLSTLLYAGEPEDLTLLEVKHPETIRKLETNMFGAKLIQFESVECLVTERFKAVSKATLLSLPELRELRYNASVQWAFLEESHYGLGTVDRMKRNLGELLDEAKKLKGNDFRFSFSGFQLTSTMLDQIDFGVQVDERIRSEYVHMEYVYLKNYHLIEPGAIDFVSFVVYNLLLSNVTGEFPRCFSQKFTNIRRVYATEVADPDHFLWFLKSLRFLKALELERTKLSQEFYDQLPASAGSLTRLRLKGGHCEDGLQLNFDFICSFPCCLYELMIEPALSLESLPSFVRSLGRLEEGCFRVRPKDQLFWLRKRGSTVWEIERDGRILSQTENPEEILNFFEGLPDDAAKLSSSSD